MNQMAGAAGTQAIASVKQATAAADQARIASRELALREIPNLDIWIEADPYNGNGDFKAKTWVANRGDYTVRNVRVFVGVSTTTRPHDILQMWSHLFPSPPIESTPHGNGDDVQMPSIVLTPHQ